MVGEPAIPEAEQFVDLVVIDEIMLVARESRQRDGDVSQAVAHRESAGQREGGEVGVTPVRGHQGLGTRRHRPAEGSEYVRGAQLASRGH